MSQFTEFKDQKYINLETFRKNGESMKTPVWFTQDGDTLFVRTVANSGKVKRVRNNGNINIATCEMNGKLLGDWIPVFAREISDEEINKKVDRLLSKKYGLMKALFQIMAKIQGRKDTILEIKERDTNIVP